MDIFLDSTSALSPRRLRRLAKKAQRARVQGDLVFEQLADTSGVSPRQLRLLADAWIQGGPSGVAALGPAVSELPDHVARHVSSRLEAWRYQHYPLETLQWKIWRNRVTVWQILPGADRLGPAEQRPVLQLRRTEDGCWHLYRKARHGEWWPVVLSDPAHPPSLQDCLDTVLLDIARQFWSPDRHPQRLPRRSP